MNVSKMFAIVLITIVAATALVYADSGLSTSVVNPTGKYSKGPATEGTMEYKELTTTRGRTLGKNPEGLITGKPKAVRVVVPEVRNPARKQTQTRRYNGGRCESASGGNIRFTFGQRSCYFHDDKQVIRDRESREHPLTTTQRTSWQCAKPQTVECRGTECPTSICRALGYNA